jgi:hypothetical protein
VDQQMMDRRADHRFPPPPSVAVQATMRPGCRLVLVDLSARGALVEAPRPLRPGGQIHLIVHAGESRHAITARVLRCAVAALDPTGGVTYRGGIVFDTPVRWPWASRPEMAASGEWPRPSRIFRGNELPEESGTIVGSGAEATK